MGQDTKSSHQTEGTVMTIEDRIAIYGPATCPWCGVYKRVYVRAGTELVCQECKREAEGLEAVWNEAAIGDEHVD